MKVLIATIAWMLCTILIILPTLAKPPPPPKPVEYTKLTWTLDYDKKTYTNFINSVRTAYKFGTICKTPVTPKSKSATGKDQYILVDIINTSGKTVTLAFQTTNLYFFGYMDEFKRGGKTYTRANFVSTEYNRLKNSDLFKTAGIKKKLPFGESYTDLQRVAGPRKDLPLGLVALSSNIDTIYGKDYKGDELVVGGNGNNFNKPKAEEIGKTMAKFALMAIQMIAEATRFKYIETTVETSGIIAAVGGDGTFKPDATFLLLQTNWDSISALVKKSSPGCKPVKSPAFPDWNDINAQMGLLNYVGNGLYDDVVVPFMEGIFGNNDDDVALEFIM